MRAIREPDYNDWVYAAICIRCETGVLGEASDLKSDEFKISGYWFDGTAVVERLFYFDCPEEICGKPILVDKDQIPAGLKLRVSQP